MGDYSSYYNSDDNDDYSYSYYYSYSPEYVEISHHYNAIYGEKTDYVSVYSSKYGQNYGYMDSDGNVDLYSPNSYSGGKFDSTYGYTYYYTYTPPSK